MSHHREYLRHGGLHGIREILAFQESLYLHLVVLEPFLDDGGQVVGVGGLMQPSCQHLAQLVQLVDHRRDNQPDDASDNADGKEHGDDDGQCPHLDMQLVLDDAKNHAMKKGSKTLLR